MRRSVAMLVLPRLTVGLDRQNSAEAPLERHPTRSETWAKLQAPLSCHPEQEVQTLLRPQKVQPAQLRRQP
jgi:hypothetical protein